MTQDFVITDQASVWVFEPRSEAARKFVRDNLTVEDEDWLWLGLSFIVDYRMAGAVAEELEDEGFSLVTQH